MIPLLTHGQTYMVDQDSIKYIPVNITKYHYHYSVLTLLPVKAPLAHMRTLLADYTRYLHFLAIWAQPHLTAH